jgi:hypothetical protein
MPAVLHFSVTRTMPVPSHQVWLVLGDFGTEHRWTRSVSACQRDTATVGVGTVRTCALPKPLMGRTHAREQLIEYQPGVALAYELDGPAGPFASAASRWSTRAISRSSTVVTVEGRFEARNVLARMLVWPIAKPFLRRLTFGVLGDLEEFVLLQSAA